MACRDIITVGASAGGIEALSQLVGQLPADLAASIFVVQHTSPDSPGLLAEILDNRSPLRAMIPADGEMIEQSMIYVAPPDHHLLLKPGHIHLTRGPHENRSRPAIDVLFRSAAVAYNSRVVGIVLSGMLNDGVVGLSAIKRCGGMAVIQDPATALYPDLPSNAMRAVEADYIVPITEMGAMVSRLVNETAANPVPLPADIEAEARFAERTAGPAHGDHNLGEPTSLACPICSGPLQYITPEQAPHYRCHTGHAFTPESLKLSQAEAVERALWSALRLMEERVLLLSNMAGQEKQGGRLRSAARYDERVEEMKIHIKYLRDLIEKIIAVT